MYYIYNIYIYIYIYILYVYFMCSRLEHAIARMFNGQHYFVHDIYNKRRLMQVEQLTMKTVLQTAHKQKTATSG